MLSSLSRRNFIVSSSSLLTMGLLEACVSKASDDTTPAPRPLTAWGDSLTAGFGGTPYPTQLAKLLNREVRNLGINGQSAAQIAARQGGTPATLTVQGNAFSGTGAVAVTAISTLLLTAPGTTSTMSMAGTVVGVPCVLTRTATATSSAIIETYMLAPVASSTVVIPANAQFIPYDAVTNKDNTQILWYGRNDAFSFTTVLASLQASAAYLSEPKQFIVLGVLNGLTETVGTYTYDAIDKFNKTLASAFPDNYLAITPPTDVELAAITYTPTAQDKTAIARGTFPTGLFSPDSLHLNTLGYQLISNRVATFLKTNNW